MMKIGHRGAAGYAPENTIKSLLTALDYGVDALEFDIRLTKDQQLVLCHDEDLKRVAGLSKNIADLTLAEIRRVKTNHDEPIPTLQEALMAVTHIPVIIEIKDEGSLPALLKVIDKFTNQDISVASFIHSEMTKLIDQRPSLPVYFIEKHHPISVITRARMTGAAGVGMNYWILNPISYWLARRNNLILYVYTVNRPLIGRILHKLYPEVRICTNFPDRIIMKQAAKAKRQPSKTTRSTSTKPKQ